MISNFGLRESYSTALSLVDDVVTKYGLSDKRPPSLHHYTSLDVALLILTGIDIRLTHCEYSNDHNEVKRAIEIIHGVTAKLRGKATYNKRQEMFYDDVTNRFDQRASTYEAFVFCMSEGGFKNSGIPLIGPTLTQDVLSFWRAYGRDGRGLCLSFRSEEFAVFNELQAEFRLNKVIYNETVQESIVEDIFNAGWLNVNSAARPNDSIEATVIALMFMLPTMKHYAFEEEKEWRFIYVPEPNDPALSKRRFHAAASGMLVPYYMMRALLGEDKDAIPPVPARSVPPIPVEIMVGPSPHQELNVRSLEFIRGRAVIKTSDIPYRS